MSYYYYGRIKCSIETMKKIEKNYEEIPYTYNWREHYIRNGKGNISFSFSGSYDFDEDICPVMKKFKDAEIVLMDEEYSKEHHFFWEKGKIKDEERKMLDGVDNCLIDFRYQDMQEIEYNMLYIDVEGNTIIEDFDNNVVHKYRLKLESLEAITKMVRKYKMFAKMQPHIVVEDTSDNINLGFYGYSSLLQIWTTKKDYALKYLGKKNPTTEILETYDKIISVINSELEKNNIEYKIIPSSELKVIKKL